MIVGVDLGGTKILSRLVDPTSGRAKGRSKVPTPRSGPTEILEAVTISVGRLAGADDAEAIGLGMPGPVDASGLVGPCPNLEGWDEQIDVATPLEQALGKPVIVANDVNCGALAEHRVGAGKGLDDFLAVFVGTGVGGGLILDGRLAHGKRGMAGEIGHTMVHPGGRLCGCGGAGHLEAYAGRAGLEREARRRTAAGERSTLVELAGDGAIKSRHIVSALTAGDELTIDLMAEAVDALAIAVGNMATVLDLQRVIFGGGVADKLGQPFIDQIAASDVFGGFGRETCELALAGRLDDAGAVGAAIAAHYHLVSTGWSGS